MEIEADSLIEGMRRAMPYREDELSAANARISALENHLAAEKRKNRLGAALKYFTALASTVIAFVVIGAAYTSCPSEKELVENAEHQAERYRQILYPEAPLGHVICGTSNGDSSRRRCLIRIDPCLIITVDCDGKREPDNAGCDDATPHNTCASKPTG